MSSLTGDWLAEWGRIDIHLQKTITIYRSAIYYLSRNWAKGWTASDGRSSETKLCSDLKLCRRRGSPGPVGHVWVQCRSVVRKPKEIVSRAGNFRAYWNWGWFNPKLTGLMAFDNYRNWWELRIARLHPSEASLFTYHIILEWWILVMDYWFRFMDRSPVLGRIAN